MLATILKMLASVIDKRGFTIKHPLNSTLVIVFLASVAGCVGWDAIADWSSSHYHLLCKHLEMWKSSPSADTFRRVAEASELMDFFNLFSTDDSDDIHIDGKRARGANRNGAVHHFIEAFNGGKIIGMIEMGAGAEGPTIEKLIRTLKLEGKLVTIDAAATTPAVVAAIIDQKGDYLLPVEGNQPSLLAEIGHAFDMSISSIHKTKDHKHGRYETRSTRTINDKNVISMVSSSSNISGIRCLCRIERTRIGKDGIETTVQYHICSRTLTPREYSRRIRSHWKIEAMHHVLDVSLGEDNSRICNAAGVMGSFCRFAYGLIAEIKGDMSFRRFANQVRANPSSLLVQIVKIA